MRWTARLAVERWQSASKPPIKRTGVRADFDWLGRETAELLALDDAALRRRWEAVFGVDASPNFGRMFMLRSIAYRLQEKSLGGLSKSAQRILDQVCDDAREVGSKRLPRTQVSAGTVLIREWRGARHRVTVVDDDVVYRGQRYKSLSEVARLITGTRWSGARVAAKAGASEVLVSSAVKNLVPKSGIKFKDRGVHRLKGVPDRWRLYVIDS